MKCVVFRCRSCQCIKIVRLQDEETLRPISQNERALREALAKKEHAETCGADLESEERTAGK